MRLALIVLLFLTDVSRAESPNLPGPVEFDFARAVYDANTGNLYISANSVLANVQLIPAADPFNLVQTTPLPPGVDFLQTTPRGINILINGNVTDWHVGTLQPDIPFDHLTFAFTGSFTPPPVVSKCNDDLGYFVCVPEPNGVLLGMLLWLTTPLMLRHRT